MLLILWSFTQSHPWIHEVFKKRSIVFVNKQKPATDVVEIMLINSEEKYLNHAALEVLFYWFLYFLHTKAQGVKQASW